MIILRNKCHSQERKNRRVNQSRDIFKISFLRSLIAHAFNSETQRLLSPDNAIFVSEIYMATWHAA